MDKVDIKYVATGVRITKTSMMFYREQKFEHIIQDDNFVRRLYNSCVIDDDVTLRDFMTIVARYPKLTNFISELIHVDIKDLHKILNKQAKQDEDISRLEVFYISQWEDYLDYKSLSEYWNFHGVSKNENVAITADYLFSVLDKTLKINNTADVYNNRKTEEGWIAIPTLINVLHTIYFELTYYGTIKDTKKLFDDIEKEVDEIKESAQIKEKTVSFNDKQKEWKRQDSLKNFMRKYLRKNAFAPFNEVWSKATKKKEEDRLELYDFWFDCIMEDISALRYDAYMEDKTLSVQQVIDILEKIR